MTADVKGLCNVLRRVADEQPSYRDATISYLRSAASTLESLSELARQQAETIADRDREIVRLTEQYAYWQTRCRQSEDKFAKQKHEANQLNRKIEQQAAENAELKVQLESKNA